MLVKGDPGDKHEINCTGARKITMKNMYEYFIPIHQGLSHDTNETKHKKVCAYFVGILDTREIILYQLDLIAKKRLLNLPSVNPI